MSGLGEINRDDYSVIGHTMHMTPPQLADAALRLVMRTRFSNERVGRDGAMVADAFLELIRKEGLGEYTHDHTIRTLAEAWDPDTLIGRLSRFYLERTDPTLFMTPTVQLGSGRYFDFVDTEKWPLQIDDIAHGLSKVCRYGGHIKHADDTVYTVAQHCVLASELVEPGFELEALLHDATESVLGDMVSPLKQLLPDYKLLEKRVHAHIARTHGVPMLMSPPVRLVDLRLLSTEKRDLMAVHKLDSAEWGDMPRPFDFTIRPWSPRVAREAFLNRWAELTDKDGPYAG